MRFLTWKREQALSGVLVLFITAIAISPSRSAAFPSLPASSPSNLGGQSLTDGSYTLGSGDRIRVEIFQVPQYSGERDVLVNGTLTLPVAGSINVEGFTLDQAETAIAQAYSRILRRPIVTVTLVTPRSLQIGVAGEVNRPGSYTVTVQGGQFPTVTQILETAGGVRQGANLRQVQVRRLQASGAAQVLTVDLWEILQTGDLTSDVSLRDGDSIFIPTASSVNLMESAQLADASFATRTTTPINIAIAGEVFRPGPYNVTGSARTAQAGVPGSTSLGELPTVTRAIQVAGGITPAADIRRIQVRRLSRTGTEQQFEVNLWELLQGNLSQDAILQDRDTILVPTATAINPAEAPQIATASFSPDTIRVNVVGEALRPGVIEVPPNTPLNQGLLAAGGFNNRAQNESVELIRLNLNGTVSRRKIEIDFADSVNEATNPALRNNDVILVRRSLATGVGDILETITTPLSRFFNLLNLPLNFFQLFQ